MRPTPCSTNIQAFKADQSINYTRVFNLPPYTPNVTLIVIYYVKNITVKVVKATLNLT